MVHTSEIVNVYDTPAGAHLGIILKKFKFQDSKPENLDPKISFRDYVQKNEKISRPEVMSRKI